MWGLKKTIDGEGEFLIMTKEGTRIGGTSLTVQGCFCMDTQKFKGYPTKVNSIQNWIGYNHTIGTLGHIVIKSITL